MDYERLKSTAAHGDAEAAKTSKQIRRLMRGMYGAPDQDYEDWQIVVLSDMDTGTAPRTMWTAVGFSISILVLRRLSTSHTPGSRNVSSQCR